MFRRLCLKELSLGEIGEGLHVYDILGGDFSDDKTASAGERVGRVLQSYFDRREKDTGPVDDISLKTRSKR